MRKQIRLPQYFGEEVKVFRATKNRVQYLELKGNTADIKRHLVSSMIHSMESTILRDILLDLNDKNITINHCHDCFQMHPNHYNIFIESVWKTYIKRFGHSSTFWDLPNTLVNTKGVFWLDDPILTQEERLDLKKKFKKFTSTFSFERMPLSWKWDIHDVKSSYPFEKK